MRNPMAFLIFAMIMEFLIQWPSDFTGLSFFNDSDAWAFKSYASRQEIEMALGKLHYFYSAYNSYRIQLQTQCRHHHIRLQEQDPQYCSDREIYQYNVCNTINERLMACENHLYQTTNKIHNSKIIDRLPYHSSDITLLKSCLRLSRRLGVKTAERKCAEQINKSINDRNDWN